jgi:hypothetical protein
VPERNMLVPLRKVRMRDIVLALREFVKKGRRRSPARPIIARVTGTRQRIGE